MTGRVAAHPECSFLHLDGHTPLVGGRLRVGRGRLEAQVLRHRGRHVVGDGADPLQV